MLACSGARKGSNKAPDSANTNLPASLSISEVNPLTDMVEIFNGTNSSIDLTNFQFCEGAANYAALSASTLVSGSLNIAPGAFTVFKTSMALNNTAGDIGLYSSTSFGSATAMVDWLQWGSGGNGREAVAVAKGIWSTGAFVTLPGNPAQALSRQNGNDATSWEQAFQSFGGLNSDSGAGDLNLGTNLIISEVDPANNLVEIFNGTGAAIDLTNFQFCEGAANYAALSASTLISGNLNLGSMEFAVFKTSMNLNNTAGDIGLYINNTNFGLAANMSDWVQWGSGGNGREAVAVTKGIWTAGNFLAAPGVGKSIMRQSGATDSSAYQVVDQGFGSSAN